MYYIRPPYPFSLQSLLPHITLNPSTGCNSIKRGVCAESLKKHAEILSKDWPKLMDSRQIVKYICLQVTHWGEGPTPETTPSSNQFFSFTSCPNSTPSPFPQHKHRHHTLQCFLYACVHVYKECIFLVNPFCK